MKYKIVEYPELEIFQQMVNELLMEGWKPQGGVSTYKNTFRILTYCQAMVKI